MKKCKNKKVKGDKLLKKRKRKNGYGKNVNEKKVKG